ncbi:hypothetical protein HY2_04270 [Hyphomonas pacifica]|nr:hypothetical protein HY2_04270 [Hyphomonas pacifica]
MIDMSRRICLTSLLAASALCACVAPAARIVSGPAAGPERATEHVITGQLTYRERIALIPGSLAEVTLIDVSLADASSTLIAAEEIEIGTEQVPIPFTLIYDSTALEPRMSYTLRATISDPEGNLLWTTDTMYPIAADNGDINIGTLLLVSAAVSSVPSSALLGEEWIVEDINRSGVMDYARVSIKFGADDTVSGEASCNRYTGKYEQTGSDLAIGLLSLTHRMCSEAQMDQENRFTDILSRVTELSFDQTGALILETDDGESLLARRW